MARHGRTLLRTANHWSLCHDDALDAYQRALEIFLRRADSVQPETELAWLKVVIKHEALAIRRARSESVSGEEPDLDARVEPTQRPLDEQVAGGERVSRSAEALRALKPDERRALMLKAQGYSYEEIGEHLGWTYTKVNRSITEGRRRFMKVFRAIESGEACEALPADDRGARRRVGQQRRHHRDPPAPAPLQRLPRDRPPAARAGGNAVKLLLPGFLLAPIASLPDGVKAPESSSRAATSSSSAARRPAPPPPGVTDRPPRPPRSRSTSPSATRGSGSAGVKDEAYALLHRTQRPTRPPAPTSPPPAAAAASPRSRRSSASASAARARERSASRRGSSGAALDPRPRGAPAGTPARRDAQPPPAAPDASGANPSSRGPHTASNVRSAFRRDAARRHAAEATT